MNSLTHRHSLALILALALAVSLLTFAAPPADASECAAPAAPEPGFTALWDGRSLPTQSGWTQSGPGSFAVVEDAGSCSLRSQDGMGLLWYSARTFGDYVLRMQFKTEDATDNSGVFVRFPSGGANTHNTAIGQGYEIQIREGTVGDGEDQKTGSIYNAQRELARNAKPVGQWNDYEIKVETPQAPQGVTLAPRITVTLNGTVVNVFQSTTANRVSAAGHIGLQNHGANDAVSFRNLRLRNLSDTQAPTTAHTLHTTATKLPSGWYDGPVDVALDAQDQVGGAGVTRTEYRLDGGAWQTYGNPEEVIFDGTQASFAKWRQAPSGSFQLLPDGSIHSFGGMGMLWYPQEYGDMALRFEWRDVRPAATGSSNSGVFVRFPDIDEAVQRAPEERWPCQTGNATTQPAWVAVNCGHEIQIYDGTSGEVQKTGSIYNFAPLNLQQAKPTTQGDWNSYEVRTVGAGDYTITVTRNGEVLNTWRNSPGQVSSRNGDAPTDLRQFARGFIGLQNHGYPDHVQIRNVRIQSLEAPEPIRVAAPGAHVIEYRSTDGAGNVEQTKSVAVNIDGDAPTTTAEVDQTAGGPATITLRPADAGSGVATTQYRLDGGEWQTYGSQPKAILDHTQRSYDAWKQAGPGSFQRQPDGSVLSAGGMGLLWYPVTDYGNAVFRFEWRDTRTDGGASNSGIFLRFPNPDEAAAREPGARHACQTGSAQTDPVWVAVYCGHEFQIYDGSTGEAQKTGSVYNFQSLGLTQAKPTKPGTWNTYEIRTTGGGDYTATILRNGEVINTFVNAPGKSSTRASDPGTAARQFARGYIGLQNHGNNDRVQIRNVTVTDLSPEAAAFTVATPGTHTLEFRSTDAAGHIEAVRTVTFTVA